MIYGLVPIGGKGTRLGLTFSKEMLPQKGHLHFNPVSNYLVNAMQEAGAKEIIFIHGSTLKKDVVDFFSHDCHRHFKQTRDGFANVLSELLINIPVQNHDKILFGMPDTVFRGNPFHEMIKTSGIVCGIFTTNDESKVDRLFKQKQKFSVKMPKLPDLQDKFWGLLKFDGSNIFDMISKNYFSQYSELGDILNHYKFSCVDAKDYLDLGTWDNYNYYLNKY